MAGIETVESLNLLESFLSNRIIGQEEAVKTITNAVLRAELGFVDPNKPKSGMLLLGSTGVGKTEIVLSLAEFLYKNSKRVKRFDMAEYQRQESLDWLLGNSKAEQGLLGDAIDDLNAQGGGILLFDEIEKAHRSLSAIFLSALDAGRLTMSNGQTKDLGQLYLFFTSNLGGSNAAQMAHSDYATVKRCVERCARNHFSPELFARFKEIVVFSQLNYDAQLGICKKALKSVLDEFSRILEKKIVVEEAVFNFLVQKGYSRDLGARIMYDVIDKEIGNALATWKLSSLRSIDSKKIEELKISLDHFKLVVTI